MRRIIETALLLILSCIPFGSMERVAEAAPLLIMAIVLTHLTLFSGLKYLEYVSAFAFLLLCWFFPEMPLLSPLLAYGLFQRRRGLALVPLGVLLFPPRFLSLSLYALALWLAWQAEYSRMQEKRYIAMRDDYAQDEILQRRIRNEEALSHEKNLEIAILKERNRISREIHDSVGHTISAAILGLEAMRVSQDEPMKTKLGNVAQTLAKGMEEIRRSLHNLHSDSISLKAELDNLTDPMEGAYRIQRAIQLDEETPLPVKRAMLSMIREALTNIRRHSDGQEISIILRELPRHYTALVKDNGTRQPVKEGLGLASMEEMARSLNGMFSFGWKDGFFVQMTIPKEEAAEKGAGAGQEEGKEAAEEKGKEAGEEQQTPPASGAVRERQTEEVDKR